MHEVSVCRDMMELVEGHLEARGLEGPVTIVRVRIGALSGVVAEALSFAFEALSVGSRFDGAKLEIERVPVVVSCADCTRESTLAEPAFHCPACGSPALALVSGDELNVVSVDVDDAVEDGVP